MNIVDLAKKVLRKKSWTKADLARACGFQNQILQDILAKPLEVKNRDIFYKQVVGLALEEGYVEEVLEVMIERGLVVEKSSVLLASIMFPDLSADELRKIRFAEQISITGPLDAKYIRNLVTTYRKENKKAQ